MAEFQRRLKLTPEQRQEIRPILDKTGERFHGIVPMRLKAFFSNSR